MSKLDKKDTLRTAWNIITSGAEWPFLPEVRFHPTRKWRFDWADPIRKIAVEIEGVVYSGPVGRHQRGVGLAADCEKYNAAIELGWKVVRLVPKMIADDPFGVITQILAIADIENHDTGLK